MKLEYKAFQGMRPAVDERSLDRVESQDAVDCDLRHQSLLPFLTPNTDSLDTTPVTLGYEASGDTGGADINHLVDLLHAESGAIPKGVYGVHERGTYVAASAVAQDTHERVYFTRPSGGMWDRGSTGGTDPFEERPVGVPAPTDPDLIAEPIGVGGTTLADLPFELSWNFRIEEIDGGALIDSGSLPDGGILGDVVQGLVPADPSLLRCVYEVNVVTETTHPFHGKVPTVDQFILYAEVFSKTGRFLGTMYPSPSFIKDETDAYVGGTRTSGVMGFEATPASGFYHCDVRFVPAGTEYSHYRSYVFTYVNDRGEESAPSAPTEPKAVTPNQKATLKIFTADRPSEAVAIRLYRTETTDAGTAFFFVTELTGLDGEEDYVDLNLSVDLPGDTLPSRDWTPPPAGLKGLTLSPKGFYAGYVGSQLYLSEPHLAYAWPTDYAIDFTGDITHVTRYGDSIAVFTDREIALIVGNNPLEVRKIKVEGFEPLTSIYSTPELDGRLYFATPTGLAALSGANAAIVTDGLLSEAFWRQSIDAASVRVVAFDGALFLLNGPQGQLYRMGVQEDGGGLVKLSDANVRDISSSSFYQGVAILPSAETGFYIFNINEDTPLEYRNASWRSRVEVADIPMAPISVRVLAESYTPPITFRAYVGDEGTEALEMTLSSDKVRKMPVLRRGREWSFELEGGTNFISLEVGTSGRVR